MFNKPKRNFRSRKRDSESDEEIVSDDAQPKNVTKTAGNSAAKTGQSLTNTAADKGKKKPNELKPVSSANSLLSFVSNEEEGEVFQIKKPSHSKRIVKQLKKESLKNKNDDVAPVKFEVSFGTEQLQEAADKKPKNGVFVAKKEEPVTVDSNEASVHSDDDEDEVSMHDILRSGQIPDASLIHLARKRRQLARERGDEFIPIESESAARDKKSSRLIRDDDDDKSDNSDDDDTFALTSRQKDLQRRKMQETILAAAEESHSEASDQELEWEEQQIRKGVNIPAQPAVSVTSGDYYADYQSFSYSLSGGGGGYTSAATVLSSIAANVAGIRTSGVSEPSRELPALTVDSVKKRLNDQLSAMVSVHRVHTHERDDVCSRAEMSSESITQLTDRTSSLEEQYQFFQEMRGYVRDLVECLNEKMTSVNYMDRCMMKLYRERADRLVKRRQEDVKDQSLEYMPGKVAGVGSEVSDDMKRRRADRGGRRARRKRMREAFGVVDHNDGMSTDDEQNNLETTKFHSTRDELTKSAATLCDDVLDEFCEVDFIRSRFETWKKDYSDSYNEAFIGLCLPKLFTPFVKLELVCWNPLEENCVDFENSRWFNSLLYYGSTTDDVSVDDLDLKLIPSIVEKVLLAKLTAVVESIWDPLSMQQTRRLTALVQRLVDNYPTVNAESKPTQLLLKTVVQRIKKCLDDDIFMPLYPKHILENRSSDAAVFFYRQFWTCIKLLHSVTSWHGVISQRQLMELACDSLIKRYLVVALQNCIFGSEFLSLFRAIVDAVPKDWFASCPRDSTLPQFDNLCRCIVSCTTSACTQLSTPTAKRDTVREVVRLLLALNGRSYAVSLARQTSVSLTD